MAKAQSKEQKKTLDETSEKAEKVAKPEKALKPEKAAKPEKAVKPEKVVKKVDKHDGKDKKALVGQVRKVVKKSRRKLGEEKFEKELQRTISFLTELRDRLSEAHAKPAPGNGKAKAVAKPAAAKPAKTKAAALTAAAAPAKAAPAKAAPKAKAAK